MLSTFFLRAAVSEADSVCLVSILWTTDSKRLILSSWDGNTGSVGGGGGGKVCAAVTREVEYAGCANAFI